MNAFHFCLAPVVLLAASIAQEPVGGPPKSPAAEGDQLQSLQSLTTEVVHSRQATAGEAAPKAGSAGSALDKPFAWIRDVEFAADGHIVNLIVEAPPTATSQDTTQYLLPAKSVRWDTGTRRWLVVESNMKVAELQRREKAADGSKVVDASKKEPAIDTSKSLLASNLLRATVAGGAGAGAPEKAVEASGRKLESPTAGPAAVFWVEPTQRQLAFAVLSRNGKCTPVPWSLLRTSGSGEAMQVRIEATPAVIDSAPTCGTAAEQPSGALRQRIYEHYGAPVPAWERKGEPSDKSKEPGKEPGGKEPGKG